MLFCCCILPFLLRSMCSYVLKWEAFCHFSHYYSFLANFLLEKKYLRKDLWCHLGGLKRNLVKIQSCPRNGNTHREIHDGDRLTTVFGWEGAIVVRPQSLAVQPGDRPEKFIHSTARGGRVPWSYYVEVLNTEHCCVQYLCLCRNISGFFTSQ